MEQCRKSWSITLDQVVVFLVIWEFFWSDNLHLRIYPYIFWPVVSVYAVLKLNLHRFDKQYGKYILMLILALLYCTMSSIISPNSKDGFLFVPEVILYILSALFVVLYGEMEKVIGYIHSLVIVHTILLFMQKFLPSAFSIIKGVAGATASRDLLITDGAYTGLTGQSSTISYYLVMGVCTSLYYYSKKKSKIYLLQIVLFLFGLALTYRRGNTLCAIIIVITYLFLGKERAYKKAFAVIAGACAVMIVGIENIPGLSMIIKKTVYQSQYGNALSGRSSIWKTGLEMFKNHPIFGNGMYSFTYYVNAVSAHNSYIQKICDLGIVGTAIFLLPFVYCFAVSIKQLFVLRNSVCFENGTFDLNLLFFLMQLHVFMIAFTEGQFETPALYVVMLLVNFAVIAIQRQRLLIDVD